MTDLHDMAGTGPPFAVFSIAPQSLLSPQWNPHPDEGHRAVTAALAPVRAWAADALDVPTLEALGWILTELVTNATAALFSYGLAERTGMDLQALLDLFGANPLWGDRALSLLKETRPARAGEVEAALGRSLEAFLRLPQIEKFHAVGALDDSCDITVAVRRLASHGPLHLLVRSSVPPLAGDLERIRSRINDPDGAREAVGAARQGATDDEGLSWLPSFTGGGGMGLLVCLDRARETGMSLRFVSEIEEATVFSLLVPLETLEQKVARVVAETVEVEPYDPSWPSQFEAERDRLRAWLPSALLGRIEHFGSTAVPGLCAKPIVDMLVEVPSLEAARREIAPRLEERGYDYFWRPSFGDATPPFYAWFIRRDEQGRRTHHIHMVEPHFEHWERLRFRDHLRAHRETARAYGELKRFLGETYGRDRVAYTEAKGAFIRQVTEQAVLENE